MKIKSLQISNVLSFKHYPNIDDAPVIKFDPNLNILIGQNGSGKSTALEVINFIFKKVLFIRFLTNQDLYPRRATLNETDKRSIITVNNQNVYSEFRLDPNWTFENDAQKIKINIELDDIDKKNIRLLKKEEVKIQAIATAYSNSITVLDFNVTNYSFSIEVTLDKNGKVFTTTSTPGDTDPGMLYLINYNYYKALINFHNAEQPGDLLPNLYESFSLISSFRNYNTFIQNVSLQDSLASSQIDNLKIQEYTKSLNTADQSEPAIFNLVRLRIAEKHFELFGSLSNVDAETQANDQKFLLSINKKLKLLDLKVEIKLTEQRTWFYSFEFWDIKRKRPIANINSLSAGQKSIVHLVFEAFGRGDLHGGLVIIDEPEIHLHHQYQDEYMRIITEINKEQKCQYILVTHSESLINSDTIDKVQRFSLDPDNFTLTKSPTIRAPYKTLIKILDNTRAVYAFFASKIIFVEGDTDRYFFKAALQELKPELNQSVAVLYMGGKGNYKNWKRFFEDFGLQVYFIGDFDNVFSNTFSGATLVSKADRVKFEDELKQAKLSSLSTVQKGTLAKLHKAMTSKPDFLKKPDRKAWKPLLDYFIQLVQTDNQEFVLKTKSAYPTIDAQIESKYPEKTYFLKRGAVEAYTGTPHGNIDAMVKFCNTDLSTWLKGGTVEATEIINIVEEIAR
ncbi:AAA family ATPase [Pedobacter ginsengisoli]|uniref:AAA family ATPase n=1 Tax=Pedobacter ginsengisoli TaxID=363852 RepID=UPI00254B194A|nr:AAA family ATPase [Pedobacter ginsengisoli]